MHYKKLTITKVINRTALLKGLKNIYYDDSLNVLMKKIDNLPYEDDLCSADEEQIKNNLEGNAEYSYSKIEPLVDYGCCMPPWAAQEYIDAKNWMNSLPEEDQAKIKILISGNVGWA